MALKYLIDTNSAIEYLSENLPEAGADWLQNIIESGDFAISVINRIELLSFSPVHRDYAKTADFVENSIVLDLDEPVILATIGLRQKLKIKLPDAIIAATAKIYGLTLVSRDFNDFKNVPGLTFVNPHDIV